MIKRWIAVGAMGAWLMYAPTSSHAQVADILLKCTKSIGVAVACMIIQGGVAKVVDISWEKLIALAFGRDKEFDKEDARPSKVTAADIEANGIEWTKLKEFLVSLFGSDPQVDDAEARTKVAASCRENYQPICRYLGVPAPRQEFADCSKIETQQDCDMAFLCSWKGGTCSKHGGTKELFGR